MGEGSVEKAGEHGGRGCPPAGRQDGGREMLSAAHVSSIIPSLLFRQ
jgi:hypothetical protein